MLLKYIALVFLLCPLILAQNLDLHTIMQDPTWIGKIPEQVAFTDQEEWVLLKVPQKYPAPATWHQLHTKTGELQKLSGQLRPWAFIDRVHSQEKIQIYEINGNLWKKEEGTSLQPIILKKEWLTFVRFLGEENFIFREGDNLFSYNLRSGQIIQLTDFHWVSAPLEEDSWYISEERKLLGYVDNLHQAQAFQEEEKREQQVLGKWQIPSPTYLGQGQQLGHSHLTYALDVSPSEQFVSLVLSPKSSGEKTVYAEIINKETYVKSKPARSRVGQQNAESESLVIYDRFKNVVHTIDFRNLPFLSIDRLEKIKKSLSEKDKSYLSSHHGSRPLRIVPGGFSPQGQLLLTIYSLDYKDKWIVLVNPITQEWKLVHHHYDEAWIHSYPYSTPVKPYVNCEAFWKKDGQSILFLSDHSGYQNLYSYNIKEGKLSALISGECEISNPWESGSGKFWYFHCNQIHPGETHFYRMPIEGGQWTALTKKEGRHAVIMNKSETVMLDLYNFSNQPKILRIHQNQNWEDLWDGRSEEFRSFSWQKPEIITYTNREQKQVYARLYSPKKSNGAAVIFIHGAGYLQNAHKGWSSYFREYMFHHLLLEKGFTVLDPDYQASAGYGRDWRTAIYRHMGGKDLTDIVDGALYLSESHGINPKKIGAYGGSYGGFLTLMAMFLHADTFRCGAALRPVTDWAYYNHPYTARILNTPTTDPESYRRSSPIYFAQGLKGDLLICHGMVDSNVHYQDSVRLAQKLIELKKENWELSSYPVEPHSFRTASGWYDEYRRIYSLFQRCLMED